MKIFCGCDLCTATSWIGRAHFPNLVSSANNFGDRHDFHHFVDSARPLNADPYFHNHSGEGHPKVAIKIS